MSNKFLAMLGCGLLALGCDGPKGSSDETTATPTKTFTVYEFGNVEAASLQSDQDNIHSVTSSKQGMVYVAGQKVNMAVIDRTDGQTWVNLDLTTGVTPTGASKNFASDHGDAQISITTPLSDGVIVYEPASRVIGILNDTSPGAITAWELADAGFTDNPLAFYEVESSGNRFIYASTSTLAGASQRDGLRFWQMGSRLKDAWEEGFTDADGSKLKRFFLSFAIGMNGDLLLGTRNNGAIYEIDKGSFGATAGQRKIKDLNPLVANTALRHESTMNKAIKRMLLVDNKYLLVGFWPEWNDPLVTSPNIGGLFYKDMSDDSALWKNAGSEYSVTGIIADSKSPKRAVIATNNGVMIFEDGEILELVEDGKFITKALIDDKDNRGNLAYKSSAKNGFAGTVLDTNMKSVAQDKDGKFYFATYNGVATMVIKTKDF